MQKKLTLILILILVLAQLCACGKPQAETSPAAESEAAAPAELPAEETPADSDEPDDTPSRTPERVLTSTKYTAEVYVETVQYGQYQIESREYAVSDGVSATGLRATGKGSNIRFSTRPSRKRAQSGIMTKAPETGARKRWGTGCMPRRSSSWSWPPGRRIFLRCRARLPCAKTAPGSISRIETACCVPRSCAAAASASQWTAMALRRTA